jgi:hypothetical protein
VSVLDDFRAAEQRVAQRLKELEPAVAEYRELEAVAKQLGIDPLATSPSTPRRTRASSARRSTRARPAGAGAGAKAARPKGGRQPRANAAAGQRAEQLLALVRARPGITVREAGQEFGVDPTSLYRVVHRLEKDGQVRKAGRSLEPVSSSS